MASHSKTESWLVTTQESKPMHDMALRVSLTTYQRTMGMGGIVPGMQLRHRRLHWVFYYAQKIFFRAPALRAWQSHSVDRSSH